MAGLLEELEKKKNTTLNRGTSIVAQTDVTKEMVLSTKLKKTNPEPVDTTQIPANIRVNQGIRNTINALEIIGYGESQKEVVENLLTTVIASLSTSEQKKIKDLNNIYNEKDKKALRKKASKKD